MAVPALLKGESLADSGGVGQSRLDRLRIAWLANGQGVRAVLIRRQAGDQAIVSRRAGHVIRTTAGSMRPWQQTTTEVPVTALHPSYDAALAAHRRQRAAVATP